MQSRLPHLPQPPMLPPAPNRPFPTNHDHSHTSQNARQTTPTAQPRPPANGPPVRLFGVNCPTYTHRRLPPLHAFLPSFTPLNTASSQWHSPAPACRCAGGGAVRSLHARRRGPAAAGGGRQRRGYNWTGGSRGSGWQGFGGPAGGGCGLWSTWWVACSVVVPVRWGVWCTRWRTMERTALASAEH